MLPAVLPSLFSLKPDPLLSNHELTTLFKLSTVAALEDRPGSSNLSQTALHGDPGQPGVTVPDADRWQQQGVFLVHQRHNMSLQGMRDAVADVMLAMMHSEGVQSDQQ